MIVMTPIGLLEILPHQPHTATVVPLFCDGSIVWSRWPLRSQVYVRFSPVYQAVWVTAHDLDWEGHAVCKLHPAAAVLMVKAQSDRSLPSFETQLISLATRPLSTSRPTLLSAELPFGGTDLPNCYEVCFLLLREGGRPAAQNPTNLRRPSPSHLNLPPPITSSKSRLTRPRAQLLYSLSKLMNLCLISYRQ